VAPVGLRTPGAPQSQPQPVSLVGLGDLYHAPTGMGSKAAVGGVL